MRDWKEELAGLGRKLAEQERQRTEARQSKAAGYRQRLNRELDPVGKDAAAFAEACGLDCEWQLVHRDAERFGCVFRIPAARVEFRLMYPDQAAAPEWDPAVLRERLSALVRAAGEARRAAHPKLQRK